MTQSSTIYTVIVALIGGIFTLLNSPTFQKWIDRKLNKDSLLKSLKANTKLNRLLLDFYDFPGIRKAVIMQTNNGGGIPRPGCVIYSSVTYPEDRREEWQNQPISTEFAERLSELYTTKEICFDVSSLQEGGDLRNLFEAQDVKQCMCVDLKEYPDKYFFLAIDFYDKTIIDENKFMKLKVRQLIQQVQNIMRGTPDEKAK